MSDPLDLLREKRLAAIVQAPERAALIARAEAAARGGITLLALPVSVPFVAEIAAEIADRTDAMVGLCEVVESEHLNVALAAGAEWVISPVFDAELIAACRQRGLGIVPSVATPSELLAASRAHEGPIAIYPAGALGGLDYVQRLARVRPSVPLVAAGGIGPDNGPQYLEVGAAAIIVDVGLFPAENDPASQEIIAVRASALVEMCGLAQPGMRASRP
ncbi:bifunctional 4-hydroxy-2-oxoglutarate aldolase/2-dehydro-3-deoxy-phosphogluconate aldolase [Sandaracinus amylolyticus]|uniref:4-hydroxy-2-oxoglutarate aldolase n=1 Tax=Sandaracinus amylolyticus TaxID=927083 RepID=A0A0F6YN04_9BACT|nr:bifunctional 4-hydroxy-2-oxoglutarate aldolase/2-dehydro-3-deoxy-phosphogluconate aldolase [Sandaracinus amylolyticus]AKF10728.1 4-hydroxy-2-oxoglutarate aldolase [Sandaracinus amylolyticus]